MKKTNIIYHFFTFLLLFGFGMSSYGQLTVTKETITLPTYKNGEPNVMPRYYEGKTHQGVQRRIYPYPMDDQLTTDKENMDYDILTVENEFIKLGIIPSLGGRIYYALDKTNDYMWFYKNDVVKPSLIGMTGNWISGSNAWGFPHHHGPNTVKPMDYTIEDHSDGSKTIWVANTDKRHRMRALVGYTMYPKSSIVEMTIKPQNRTAISNSFLFWTNPSVHVDTTYQVIFPPSVQYVTQHAKREMTTWPIADGNYNHFDYTNVDISKWKNVGVPSSFFSWKPQEDYFGGYDHGKQAGTAWIGNHHIMPGMKYWADGNNPAGVRINKGLTDTSSQYIELMAGFYTDNQPDYSWIQPYEAKSGKMIWFPIRELEGLKYANKKGALNLEQIDGIAKIRMNATTSFQDAKVTLESKGKIVYDEIINIGPDKPFSIDVKIPVAATEDDLEISLVDANGGILLQFAPANHHPPVEGMPKSLTPPALPKDVKTIEELYLIGLRLNQFYNASNPMPYYEEALRRDPNDYRVNTQLGILAIKAKDWIKAEAYLQTAVDRITMNYTRAKDGEALYYLGITQRALEKTQDAYNNFYKATWSSAWHSAAYYQLAEMDCNAGNIDKALGHIDRALSTNAENDNIVILKSILLRKSGKYSEAKEILERLISIDLINHWALNELYLIQTETGDSKEVDSFKNLTSLMRNEVESYLELATSYGNCGLFKEAKDVLIRLELAGNTYPMLYYYLGYYNHLIGDSNQSLHYYKKAATMPHNYCFPYRAESIVVLEHAMKVNPQDTKTPYYLGNLFYEQQPNRAIKEWEYSRELDGSFYIVHRNLGLAYEEVLHDNDLAMKSYEKAVSMNPNDPRLLFELDKIYEKNKVSSQRKYELLKDNNETARKRTETLLRFATRSLEVGKYQEAIDLIENNTFPQLEGEREMQDTYLSAHTLRSMEYLDSESLSKAEASFKKIIDYPVGRFGRSRWAQFNYLLGITYDKIGDKDKANDYFKKAIAMNIPLRGADTEYIYYQGLALKSTGQKKASIDLFTKMLTYAKGTDTSTFFTQFEGGQSEDYQAATKHYLAGLAFEGMGEAEKANAEFEKTLTFNPSHVWARVHLNKNLGL
jgi:tetratricopeptide (TPR) repeat protein